MCPVADTAPSVRSDCMEEAAEDSVRCGSATAGGHLGCSWLQKGLVAKRKEWCRAVLARQQWRRLISALWAGNSKFVITDAASKSVFLCSLWVLRMEPDTSLFTGTLNIQNNNLIFHTLCPSSEGSNCKARENNNSSSCCRNYICYLTN